MSHLRFVLEREPGRISKEGENKHGQYSAFDLNFLPTTRLTSPAYEETEKEHLPIFP